MATVLRIGEPVNGAERQAMVYLRDHLPASLVLYNCEILRGGEIRWLLCAQFPAWAA